MSDSQLTKLVFWLAFAVFLVMLIGGSLSVFTGDYSGAIISLVALVTSAVVMFYAGVDR